jgi:hypothetical protein
MKGHFKTPIQIRPPSQSLALSNNFAPFSFICDYMIVTQESILKYKTIQEKEN